jgi:glycosyltransferase involved in cell wall biosynthesis
MRVVHLNGFLSPKGGVETYLSALMPRLESEGIEQTILYGAGDPRLWSRARHVPSLLSLGRAAGVQSYEQVGRILAELRPDVIHVHNVQSFTAIQAAWEAAPTVLTLHDYRYLCPSSNFYYRRTRSICGRKCGAGCFVKAATHRCLTPRPGFAWNFYRRVRWMSRRFHHLKRVISPCQYGAERLRQAGCMPEQVAVLPYFCPLSPSDSPRPVPDRPLALYIGRLAENKGFDVFIKAMGMLPDRVNGMIVGNLDESNEAGIRRQFRQAGCEHRMSMRPWASRDEIRGLINQASVMVFPSLWAETLGIVGLESLACGVPVVASDVGGAREWLLPGKTGVLVAPGDPRQLADGILAIIESPELQQSYGRQGIQLIRERFLAEHHVSKLLAVYREAA